MNFKSQQLKSFDDTLHALFVKVVSKLDPADREKRLAERTQRLIDLGSVRVVKT